MAMVNKACYISHAIGKWIEKKHDIAMYHWKQGQHANHNVMYSVINTLSN